MSLPVAAADIRAAWARISGHTRRTPVIQIRGDDVGLATDAHLNLKLELLQHTGSFKPRGAFNNILSVLDGIGEAGVAAASGGNHGIAVAYAARRLGLHATIFVPATVSPLKLAAIKELTDHVIVTGGDYDEAQRVCADHAHDSGAHEVHPFGVPATVAGQGTIALEWDEQTPGLDTVLVAVGGGGLISGLASWWHGDHVNVVGVEPRGSRALHAALEAGGPVDVAVDSVAADSLGPRNVGDLVHRICSQAVSHVVLVDDGDIVHTQAALWRALRLPAEAGGATALAALLSGAYRPRPGERVGVLVCGGNTDPRLLTP
ncbi:threonine/serine dehydratase [Streptosporangium sp. NBC_01756]|uniref:threonine/serine dehydratase n=1 Tax=Streptosporangium sp. NBC_01756 TaxID=2975950 RepID=UPI002DDC5E0E|nr:threonine/serine dehydratase [Streptosporangium sp. NBC_01756]WSC89505.1 threonine/serine dehydratase [Streptosporangium sp. NBC_01756]